MYRKRKCCNDCSASIAPADIMFHCPYSNTYHKAEYDLCESCAVKKALTVYCQKCDKQKMNKVRISGKHKHSQCGQCNKSIQKTKSNPYIYQCPSCKDCVICIKCAKNPSILHHEQQEYLKKMEHFNKLSQLRQVMTTLHGYLMNGPYVPDKNMVWYCDNKTCQYTKHGLYRKYRIENWRSSVYGKKFVLCDGVFIYVYAHHSQKRCIHQDVFANMKSSHL